jgi:hypothetical protein
MSTAATIPASEVRSKKKIGVDGEDAVYEVSTVGGLYMVLAARKKGTETLGVGSHKAVARWLASKKAKGLQFTELNKSEFVGEDCIRHLLPKWEAITNAVRGRQGY